MLTGSGRHHRGPVASSSVTLELSVSLVLVTTKPSFPTVEVDHRFTGKKLQPTLPRVTRSHGPLQTPSTHCSPSFWSQGLCCFHMLASQISMASRFAEQRTRPASHS